MKLAMNSKAGMMDIDRISSDGSKLIFTGTILGTIPVRAVLTPAEMRKALSMMSAKTMFAAAWIFIFK